jgi:ProP effector
MNTMSSVAESPEAHENAAEGNTPGTGSGAATPQSTTPETDADSPAASATPEAGAQAQAAAGTGTDAQSPRALLKQMQQQFTAFRNCLPLAIGIDKQVLARMPNLNRKLMRAALGIHTGSMRYLRAMEKATVRYDLDGNPGAEVTETHRQHAKELLQERFKKEADRKRAEREAAVQAEAERKRQEKLQQLASKFSRK